MSRFFFEASTPAEKHVHGIWGDLKVAIVSPYQIIEIIDSSDYGRVLMIDGRIQSAEIDEFIYHEALVHPAAMACTQLHKALIIGGGEGAVARELLKYNTISTVVMVDIDEEVIEIAKKYLPTWHCGAFEDPRLHLVIADAKDYIKNDTEKYDLIVVDVTEPMDETSANLFIEDFYKQLKACLNDDGIISVQAGCADICNIDLFCSIYKTLQPLFRYTYAYERYVLSYVNSWGFVVASDTVDIANIPQDQLQQRALERNVGQLRLWSPEIHHTLFTLPPYLKQLLQERGKYLATTKDIVH